jgi:cell division septum initiation protein DivIVA
MADTLLTDIANGYNKLFDENEKLRQQLEAAMEADAHLAGKLSVVKKQLAECQARETSLRDDMKLASVQYMGCGGNLLPGEVVNAMNSILNRALALSSDSTALDTMLKQAKREGILYSYDYILKNGGLTYGLRHKAEELE